MLKIFLLVVGGLSATQSPGSRGSVCVPYVCQMPFPPVASFGDLDLPDMYTETKSPFITLKADSWQRFQSHLEVRNLERSEVDYFSQTPERKVPAYQRQCHKLHEQRCWTAPLWAVASCGWLLSWRWEQKPAASGLQTLLGVHFPASGRHRGIVSGCLDTEIEEPDCLLGWSLPFLSILTPSSSLLNLTKSSTSGYLPKHILPSCLLNFYLYIEA